MKYISVGFYNYIPSERVVLIMDYNSSAARRLREVYREKYGDDSPLYILDFTRGRKSQSCILLDTGHIILSLRSRKNIYRMITDEVEVEDAESKTP